MNLSLTTLPTNSILKSEEKIFDYVDSYQGLFNDTSDEITSTHVGKAFFMSSPPWVEKLFDCRNYLVRIFGLKTSVRPTNRQMILENFTGEKGEQIGLFRVFEKTKDEIILGEDDKHLDFRVSLFIDREVKDPSAKKLIISTTVKFNNFFGRLYFMPVRLFHQLIVPAMLKGVIKNIEKQRIK